MPCKYLREGPHRKYLQGIENALNSHGSNFFMPARITLSTYLQRRRPTLLQRLRARINGAPELSTVRRDIQDNGGLKIGSELDELLSLLATNIGDPSNREAFAFAEGLIAKGIQRGVSTAHLARIANLYRQLASRDVKQHFQGHAHSGDMLQLLNEQMTELEDLLHSGTPENGAANNAQARLSEKTYASLLQNASEAIISFQPGKGTILEVNAQAERLLARPREELLKTPFAELFPPEHRAQIQWLVSQKDGTSLRLEDMTIRRPGPIEKAPSESDAGAETEASANPPDSDASARTGPNDTQVLAEDPLNYASARNGANANLPTVGMERSGRRLNRGPRLEVPVSLSCNWITVDGNRVAQAILRDVTQLRQSQRELQSYAGQLEERVASRTRELQQSEERYRALFLQEQRRAQHLSLINDVQRCALDNPVLEEFLQCATIAIQNHFRECDVTFFSLESQGKSALNTVINAPQNSRTAQADHETQHEGAPNGVPDGELVAVAQSGGYGLAVPPGGRHPLGLGLPGRAALNGQTLHYSRDRTNVGDEQSERAPGVYRESRAEMCVPVVSEGRVMGVVAVQCQDAIAFDARDAVALETACTIIASHLHSSRLFREIEELNQFHQTLLDTMSHSLLVVDTQGTMEVVNVRLCQVLGMEREQLVGQPMAQAFGQNLIDKHDLESTIRQVTEDGIAREVPEVQVWANDSHFVFDTRIFRVYFRGEAKAVLLLINITLRWRKTHQLQLMHEISRFFQASLDIDRVLHTVLTCITAGSSLGFNRAFVLLRHTRSEGEGSAFLEGAMALGPSSPDEAGKIWHEMSQRDPSLQEILAGADSFQGKFDPSSQTPLQNFTRAIKLDFDNPALAPFVQVMDEGSAICATPADLFAPSEELNEEQRAQYEAASQLFTASEIAVAPLLTSDGLVGVVLADNLYSGNHIDDDDVQLLDTLSQQAGLTVGNALTYQALQKAQREVVSAERLVAVGQMAARVSHEIRNPLSTIGGFARGVLRKPDDAEGVARKAAIIVDEVKRLEELLTDLLDMARPRELNLSPHSLNDVVEHALLLADADLRGGNIQLVRDFAPDLPPVVFDRSRLLQAVLNIARNGAQAMTGGGTLRVSTRLTDLDHSGCEQAAQIHQIKDDPHSRNPNSRFVEILISDTGVGISQNSLKQIFDPFFSTKLSGSGLGLPVTRRILQDHGGDISAQSEEGKGTTFVLCLPLRSLDKTSDSTEELNSEFASEIAGELENNENLTPDLLAQTP